MRKTKSNGKAAVISHCFLYIGERLPLPDCTRASKGGVSEELTKARHAE